MHGVGGVAGVGVGLAIRPQDHSTGRDPAGWKHKHLPVVAEQRRSPAPVHRIRRKRRLIPWTRPRIRVNVIGTQGFSGSPSGPTSSGELIYQQVKGRRSDLKFFNNGVRTNPPAGVNSPAWEYR